MATMTETTNPNIIDQTGYSLEEQTPINLLQRSIRMMLYRRGFACPVCLAQGTLRLHIYAEADYRLWFVAVCGVCDGKGSASITLRDKIDASSQDLAEAGRRAFRDLIRDIDSPKRNALEELMRGATDRRDIYGVLLRCALCDLPIGSRAYCPRCGQKVDTKDPNKS